MNSTALWYATRASGLMALILLTLTMVLGLVTTSRARARNWPGFAQQELHRRISILAVVFLGIHVVTSVLDTYVHIGWAAVVVPGASPYSRFWVGVGAVSLDLLLAVFVSSLLRHAMNPGAWRALHWLAYLSWPIALAHTFGMGTDSREGWVIALGVACVLAVAVALAYRLRTAARQAAARTRPLVGRRTPPKHLELTVPPRQGRAVPSPSEALPTVGRYRLLGHPTDLAGHLAALGPVPLPSGRTPRLARGASVGARGLGPRRPRRRRLPRRHQAQRGPRRRRRRRRRGQRHGGRARQRQGQAAPDPLSSPRAGRRAAPRRGERARRRVIVCVPAGRDHVASAVGTPWPSASRHGVLAGARARWCGRRTASSPARSRRWSAGSSAGVSLPSFRPDKGVPLRIGRRAHWCTTPRPWPTSP